MVKQTTKSTTISYEKQHQVLKNYATLQPPKIPCNKYYLYLKTMLPIVNKEKPNMRKYDIVLEIRDRWKTLSDDEKMPYTKQYEKNMKVIPNHGEGVFFKYLFILFSYFVHILGPMGPKA